MTCNIYMYIIIVAYLYQGEKINACSLNHMKVKNGETKTNDVEIIFNFNQELLKWEKNALAPADLLWKKKSTQ